MSSRRVSWDDSRFLLVDFPPPYPPDGITLRVETTIGSNGTHVQDVTLSFPEWVNLASHIKWEQDRREEMEPRIWHISVDPIGEKINARESLSGSKVPGNGNIRSYDDGTVSFYVRGSGRADAEAQASAILSDYRRLRERLAR